MFKTIEIGPLIVHNVLGFQGYASRSNCSIDSPTWEKEQDFSIHV